MIESYAKFYGVEDDPKVSKLSYTKLQQASRDRSNSVDPAKKIPNDMLKDPAFKQAQKRFFQDHVSDTSSQYNLATAKFFGAGPGKAEKIEPSKTLGNSFQNVQSRVVPTNMNGERFQNDTSKFFGNDAEVKSQGSIFEQNKNAFFGQSNPKGFKIEGGNGQA